MAFERIKGQDKVIGRLRGFLRAGRLAGAYLFSGPQGIGKGLAALEFAKAINCEQNRAEPCDSCSSCARIEKNQHPDLHLIDSSDSEIKIEAIRQLQKESGLKPYEARKKVFIIPEAQRLNPASASCLLKTLEEPAANSLIILVTDKPALLLKTIVSRCQLVKFSPILRRELEALLERDYQLKHPAAHFLAYFCEGRIGPALELKDGDILDAKNAVIDSALSLKASAGTYAAAMAKLLPPAKGGLRQERDTLREYFNILASWFRDIYLLKCGAGAEELINFDRKDELAKVAGRAGFPEIEGALQQISSSLLYLEQNVNTKLLLAYLKWALRGN